MRGIKLLLLIATLLPALSTAAPLTLSQEEAQWLASHPEIRLGVDPNWAPFEFIDETGQYRGIAADYMALLSKKLGIRMVPAAGLSWSQVMEQAKNGEVDLLPAVMKTAEREKFLTFTKAYADYPMVIVTRDKGGARDLSLGDLKGKRIGVVSGYVTEELLRKDHPELLVVPVETIEVGLQGLALGRYDAFVDNIATASHTIQQRGISGLRISSHTPYNYPLAFAVRKDWPLFASILDKALESIEPGEHRAIDDHWIHVKEYEGIALERVLAVATPVAVIVALFVGSLLYWNRRLKQEITRRQQIEERLQISNRSLSDSQEIAHVGNWEWNIVSGELRWSDEIYRIFGLVPQEFGATYEAFLERVHPADRQEVISAVNDAVLHDTRYDIVHRLIRPNGELRIVKESGLVYRDADDKPLRMLGVVHDITPLKLVEQNLRHERDTAQRYLDIAGVMLLILNRDGQITLINRHGLGLLGYDNELQLLGKNWFDHFVAAEQRDEVRRVFIQLMAGNIQLAEHYINPITNRYGQQRWISWQNTLLQAEDGTINGVLSSGQDITEQRRSEEKLRLSDKVFEYSSEAILITDQENRIITANPGLLEQTGYTLDELVGQNPKIFRSGHHDAAFYDVMWGALNNEGRWAGEVWDRRKNGSIYPKWLSINVVRDPQDGEITHHIAIFTDITQRKADEEHIRYLAHHDPLTDLPNRLLLQDRLELALAKAHRNNTHVAVLFIDLDRFKPINDLLGHHIGDLLLQEVAHRLKRCVRGSDTVARLGGDEFVIVLDGVEGAHDIHRVTEKVIAEVCRMAQLEGHDLYVTPSIGISLSPSDGTTPEVLIQHADSAMYQAKKSGLGTYQYFSAPPAS